MSNALERRLHNLITRHPTNTPSFSGADIDHHVHLIARCLTDTEPRITCLLCVTWSTQAIAAIHTEMEGGYTPLPDTPTCWGQHDQEA